MTHFLVPWAVIIGSCLLITQRVFTKDEKSLTQTSYNRCRTTVWLLSLCWPGYFRLIQRSQNNCIYCSGSFSTHSTTANIDLNKSDSSCTHTGTAITDQVRSDSFIAHSTTDIFDQIWSDSFRGHSTTAVIDQVRSDSFSTHNTAVILTMFDETLSLLTPPLPHSFSRPRQDVTWQRLKSRDPRLHINLVPRYSWTKFQLFSLTI